MLLRTIFSILITCLIGEIAYSHDGELDSEGCHRDMSTKTYHCHGIEKGKNTSGEDLKNSEDDSDYGSDDQSDYTDEDSEVIHTSTPPATRQSDPKHGAVLRFGLGGGHFNLLNKDNEGNAILSGESKEALSTEGGGAIYLEVGYHSKELYSIYLNLSAATSALEESYKRTISMFDIRGEFHTEPLNQDLHGETFLSFGFSLGSSALLVQNNESKTQFEMNGGSFSLELRFDHFFPSGFGLGFGLYSAYHTFTDPKFEDSAAETAFSDIATAKEIDISTSGLMISIALMMGEQLE